MSDNGASQEGGPFGMVNAMGPYNLRREPLDEKIARIDDIGGPDTHSNFPLGWAMAANTPLRRYKQNTHGGGIRDPLVMAWNKGIAAQGRAAPPVLPRQRSRADPARRRRRQAAQGDQRRQADADRGHQLCQEPARRQGAGRSPSRSISRCSAIAAWCRTAGRPCPSIRRAATSSSDKWELYHLDRTSTRSTISPSRSPSG